jgi:Tfp pilus assembly protein PilF
LKDKATEALSGADLLRGLLAFQRGDMEQALQYWGARPAPWCSERWGLAKASLGTREPEDLPVSPLPENIDLEGHEAWGLALSAAMAPTIEAWVRGKALWAARGAEAALARARFWLDRAELRVAELELEALGSRFEDPLFGLRVALCKAERQACAGQAQAARKTYEDLISKAGRWLPPPSESAILALLDRRARIDELRCQAWLGLARLALASAELGPARSACRAAREASPQAIAPILFERRIDAAEGRAAGNREQFAQISSRPSVGPEAWLAEGWALLEGAAFSEAEPLLQRGFALARSPGERADALLGLARVARAAGREKEARTLAQQAAAEELRAFGIAASLSRELAPAARRPLKPTSSDEELGCAIAIHLSTREAPALPLAAQALRDLGRGRAEQARQLLGRARMINPEAWQPHCALAILAYQQGEKEEAASLAAEALRAKPEAGRAWWLAARSAFDLKKLSDAIRFADEAVRREPWRAELYQLRASIHRAAGSEALASADEERLASFEPSANAARDAQVQTAIFASDGRGLFRLARDNPGRPAILFDYGRVYGVVGANNESMAKSTLALSQALYLEPRLELGYGELINQGVGFGNRGVVQTLRQIASEDLSFHTDALFMSGVVRLALTLSQGLPPDEVLMAREEFLAVLAERPDFVFARVYAAASLSLLGASKAALAELSDFGEEEQRNPALMAYRGALKARASDSEGALADFAKSDLAIRAKTLRSFEALLPESMLRDPRYRALRDRS